MRRAWRLPLHCVLRRPRPEFPILLVRIRYRIPIQTPRTWATAVLTTILNIYGVPYAADADGGDASAPNDPNAAYADDEGGPPAFDRHAPGPDSYPPPRPTSDPSQAVAANDPPASSDSQSADPQSVSAESPTPLTTLVFKDGHVSQVANYAIVSQTLYDLTPGHPRRIALADLDLSATEKQNDDRGVTFQLPPNAQAN